MANRETISNELRFKIFKRDNFTCQYCGRKAPDVVLELDHIRPVSKGGDNRESNLITSCFNCNRGKNNTLVPQMEDETAQDDFERNFQKYKQRYGYYTNYIAKVIRNETGRRPIKLYIDQFVKRSFKTDEEFYEFKKEFADMGKALNIVRTCTHLGLSYKAYKRAFTDKRNQRMRNFKKNKESYNEFDKIRYSIYECAKSKGHGKNSFKNNMMQTVMEYFMSVKFENGEELNIEREKTIVKDYVDTCAELLNEAGKEYIYFAMFSAIDSYFYHKEEFEKTGVILGALPSSISVGEDGRICFRHYIKKFKKKRKY